MRFQLLTLSASGAVLLALLGCRATRNGSFALPPSPSGVERLFSAEEIEAARTLCLNKCVKCHKFYDPAKYDDAKWGKWMTKMSKKAKLQEAQAELLGRYLQTFRHPTVTNTSSLKRRSASSLNPRRMPQALGIEGVASQGGDVGVLLCDEFKHGTRNLRTERGRVNASTGIPLLQATGSSGGGLV